MFKNLFNDPKFYKTLFQLALPITVQYFISSSISLVGVMMVGQLGEVSIAALGLGNQIFFLVSLLIFGLSSGYAIFAAQFWGANDLPNVRRVLGICLTLGMIAAGIFTLAAVLLPHPILSIYTKDPEVIREGVQYLRIAAFSYVPYALSMAFAFMHRSTGQVRLPMFVSAISLLLSVLVSYLLIFGHLGLPALGVRGAAVGMLFARLVEAAGMLSLTYLKRTAIAASPKELFSFNLPFLTQTLSTAMPAVLNEMAWSFAVTTYNIVYARIGTESIAAINITTTIEEMAFVVFFGLANAGAIIIGNTIGAGEQEKAFTYGKRYILIGIAGALVFGQLTSLSSRWILNFYNISPTAADYVRNILLIFSFIMWIKVFNLMLIVGILRSGGDTRFTLLLEMSAIWGIGVPMAVLGGLVLHLEVYWVYLMVISEELVKAFFGYRRFRSRKWVHNLTVVSQVVEPLPAAPSQVN
ncbi:hypothetical protein ADN00_11030 [Ornatilinea apprima]|uniref:Multidrug transporter MATE n=1 Tax=Ornatilinea apprima TaxID=1134406 RepID=A0A0N8GMX3_9CHLR|nr:MATE family efflux transporter [Ornatilinea apprima]KPL76498.1 hypothetical protein ADN00_11030 [Ornatilinea apprima]